MHLHQRAAVPAQAAPTDTHLSNLIERLLAEFPDARHETVLLAARSVWRHPSADRLPRAVLLARTERIVRARLRHVRELTAPEPPD